MSTAVTPDGDGGVLPLTGLLDLDGGDWEALSGLVDEADWMELLASTPAGMDCAGGACCDGTADGRDSPDDRTGSDGKNDSTETGDGRS